MKGVSLGNEIYDGTGRSWKREPARFFYGCRFCFGANGFLPTSGQAFVKHQRKGKRFMAKKVAIDKQSNEELLIAVGKLEALINSKNITWVNAKGEARTCPYSVFSHTGKLLVAREDDAEGWDSGTAVQIKVEAERRNGGSMASVRATHAIKAGTCSATVRTAGMNADLSEVTVQLADAQKLQGQARAIRAELFKRAEAEKEAAAIEAEAAKQTKVSDLVKAAFSGGSITADEAELLNAELHAEVA